MSVYSVLDNQQLSLAWK